jgi:branched-chain amino acid transport system permease protein
MSYLLHLLIFFEIYALVALSLNLLIGYSGLLQVAHAAYFGVGSYACSLLMLRFGVGFMPALLLSGLLSALFSLLVSLPACRFKGDFFVMISLAVQVLLYSVMYNMVKVTNGPYGLTGIPAPSLGAFVFDTRLGIFLFFGVIICALATGIGILKKSPFGLSLQAMRDDYLAALSLGLSIRKLKIEAFLLAAFTVGIAGGMYASYVHFIDPSSFTLDESILMFSMVVVGGTGNVRGPLIGAAVLVALPELLRFIHLPDTIASNVRLLVYGFLLILLMHLRPQGLLGKYRFE